MQSVNEREIAPSHPDGPIWDELGQIRVLIADGQLMFSEALALTLAEYSDLSILEEHPTTAVEAVEVVQAVRPDVVILDLWIPAVGGVGATKAITSRSAHTKVLVTSFEHSPARIREVLEAGGAGYLPKSLSAAKVAEGVRRAQQGEWPVFADELEDLLKRLEERKMASDEAARRLVSVTPRQIEVLGLLALGLPKEEIARRLGISPGTVSGHIHKILARTGASTHAEAISMARSAQLIGPSPATPGSGF